MDFAELMSFAAADGFMASLLLPLQTQIVITAVKIFGGYPILWIVLVATLGSSLGSMVNWFIGRLIAYGFKLRTDGTDLTSKWAKVTLFLQTKGTWLALGVGVPFIGAPLTVFMGAASVSIKKLIAWFVVGHLLSYLFLAYLP